MSSRPPERAIGDALFACGLESVNIEVPEVMAQLKAEGWEIVRSFDGQTADRLKSSFTSPHDRGTCGLQAGPCPKCEGNQPTRPRPTPVERVKELTVEVALLESQLLIAEVALKAERDHADRWQALAGRYDEVRDWLRICKDTPEGHAEFYNEAAKLIFPEANS